MYRNRSMYLRVKKQRADEGQFHHLFVTVDDYGFIQYRMSSRSETPEALSNVFDMEIRADLPQCATPYWPYEVIAVLGSKDQIISWQIPGYIDADGVYELREETIS